MCGEMAGDTVCASLLPGLGLDELPMLPSTIPHGRRIGRESDYQQLVAESFCAGTVVKSEIFSPVISRNTIRRSFAAHEGTGID